MWNNNNRDPYYNDADGPNNNSHHRHPHQSHHPRAITASALAAYNDVNANAAAFAAAANADRYAAALNMEPGYYASPDGSGAYIADSLGYFDPTAAVTHFQQQQLRSPTLTGNYARGFGFGVSEEMEQRAAMEEERRRAATAVVFQVPSASRGKPTAMAALQQQRNIGNATSQYAQHGDEEMGGASSNSSSSDDSSSQDQSSDEDESELEQIDATSQPHSSAAAQASMTLENIHNHEDESETSTSSDSDSDDDRAIGTLGTKKQPKSVGKAKSTAKEKPAASGKGNGKAKKATPATKKASKTPATGSAKAKGRGKKSVDGTVAVADSLGNIGAPLDSSGLVTAATPVQDSLATLGAQSSETTKSGKPRQKPGPKKGYKKNPNDVLASLSTTTSITTVGEATTPATEGSTWASFRDKSRELQITPAEYENVTALLQQFCTLPLLAEFTKPLHILHPELAELYQKVVATPMDLSHICRRVDQHSYKYTRHVQLDVWRMCSNCILFHTDARAQKENVAIPSFVSIALHLRDYFNALWEEYMVPSSGGGGSWEHQHGNWNSDVVVEAVEVKSTSVVATPSASSFAEVVPVDTVVAGEGFSTPATTAVLATPATAATNDAGLEPSAKYGGTCSVAHPLSVFRTRNMNRKLRYAATASTPLSYKTCTKTANFIQYFLDNGGRVDPLDGVVILGDEYTNDGLSAADQVQVIAKMNQMKKCLIQCAEALTKAKLTDSDGSDEEDVAASMQITVHEVQQHFHSVSNLPCVVAVPKLQALLRDRLDRILHKLIVPLYEAGCRGVNQSSIWGCMAAAIWARESLRKPYWPALVLGILAPEDQKEDWHITLTERNEGRLPEKLRVGLSAGKKKAAMALEKNRGKEEQMSFFLVEFLGKHQFTWVREADILENFDPKQDPNDPATPIPGFENKKRKAVSHSTSDTPVYSAAVQECQWAVEEFDMQVRDPCGDLYAMDEDQEDDEAGDDEEDSGFKKYSFAILAQSIPADEDEIPDTMEETDDEGEELYASAGLIDMSLDGRKKFKARASSSKKQREAAARKKAEQIKREKAAAAKARKEQATISASKTAVDESKKRKAVASTEKVEPKKKQKLGKPAVTTSTKGPKKQSNLITDKKGRARAKVRAYVTKLIQEGLLVASAPTTTSGPGGSVETSGLMGMALAFRAAAGEIPGANPREESEVRPWDFVDVDSAATSQERCNLIQQQIELIENALATLEEEELRRLKIIASCASMKGEKNIVKAEPVVCNNGFTVKKKRGAAENGSAHSIISKNELNDVNNNAAHFDANERDQPNSQKHTDSESDAETEDEGQQDDIQW